jgi:hypothetical protein
MVTAPAPVVVPAVDVIDHHRSIAMPSPLLPVAVAEPLDPQHSGHVTLHHNPAYRAAVAGVAIVYRYASRHRAAADHDLC